MPLKLNVIDEFSTLDTLILGIATDMNAPGTANPKSRFHIKHSSYPTQDAVLNEMDAIERVLLENGVKIFRPQNIKNKTQIFTRDLGFAIGDEFFISSMNENRQPEITGIQYLIDLFDKDKIVDTSTQDGVNIEGGDVIVHNEKVFVGLSGRTNKEGVEFLRKKLEGKKTVMEIQLIVDRNDHEAHALHLDCVFQPLGKNHAIIYEDGIKNPEELYKSINLPDDNIYKVNEWQFVSMFTNVLSISNDTVIIEREFIELKYWLLERGFKVIEVNFRQTSRLSGLLRCATLPLIRK
ncbi:MAG: arginine deiminase family protein [Bacteroidota bacterium]|nr:arginine deiminase family protein [Bacteroidota bacterium]